MSLTVARVAAVVACLLAFAGRLLTTFWVQPMTWRLEPELGIPVGLAMFALSAAVPVLLYIWMTSSLRRPPASLVVDSAATRFVVPASPYYAGIGAVAVMWCGAGMLDHERIPNSDRIRVANLPEAIPVFVTAVMLAVGFAAVFILVKLPCVILDPAGITVRYLDRRTRISWDDLAPGGPLPPVKRRAFRLRLYRKPPRPGAGPPAENLPIGQLHVNATFLAAVIRHYVEHPERRSSIGTDAELTRLRATRPGM